jgi:hypothetical protein
MQASLLDLKAQYQTIKDEVRDVVKWVLEFQHLLLCVKMEALEGLQFHVVPANMRQGYYCSEGKELL